MSPEVRLGDVVAAVVQQAMRDYGVSRIALLDDDSPEAELLARILHERLAPGSVVRITDAADLDPVLHALGADLSQGEVRTEARRLRARLIADSIAASPGNKTALLLGGPLPPEPLLPFGDLYASDVEQLTGGWSAPPSVRALAQQAGGIGPLDEALREWAEGRNPEWGSELSDQLRTSIASALAAGRASRITHHVVPKLGSRTLAVDLYD
ncbi:MAG TPA: hypothetical protein VFI91_13215 [Longimicrobiaceae bacterium]|nr:hypothetical protein [Longimicrobiaceae bacterium]